MPLISQARFPRLWNIFQYWLGGTVDKRALYLSRYADQRSVLEVGCSTGNISKAFTNMPDISYTGIDIDRAAISLAQKRFAAYPRFRFICGDFIEYSRSGHIHDFIIFAGICHHLTDDICREMLEASCRLMGKDSILVIVDPILPDPEDPRFMWWCVRLDHGRYVRSFNDMRAMIAGLHDLEIREMKWYYVGATPLSFPRCGRFMVAVLRRSQE